MSGVDLGCLLERVDPCSARIVWHLMWEGHAHLADLGRVSGLDHAEVLDRIRSVINPLSNELYGCDLLTFSVCRVDPASGRKVTFAWWLDLPSPDGPAPAGRPLAEVFEEEDGHLVIMAQVGSPLRLTGRTRVSCRNGLLRVLLEKG